MFAGASPRLDALGNLWTRLPDTKQSLVHPELAVRTSQLSGVRVAFTTDSRVISGTLDTEPDVMVSLTGNGWTRWTPVGQDGLFEFTSLSGELQVVEVWLPHAAPSRLRQLSVSVAATASPPPPAGPRWVCYGSSITQGNHVSAPHDIWPTIVCRSMKLDLRSLGFAGQAHLDTVVADDIRNGSADLISICAGINTHNAGTTSLRMFWSQLSHFVETVRKGHPETPIVLISPIASPDREQIPASPRMVPSTFRRGASVLGSSRAASLFGPTLSEIRNVVHEIGDRFAQESDGLLSVLDGRELLDSADASALPDGLHPDTRGNILMAERFERHLVATYPNETAKWSLL